MKKKQNTVVIILIVLATVLIGYFAWVLNSGKKRYSWYESYDPKDAEKPYGTLYLRRLLEGYRPGTSFTLNESKPLDKILPDAAPNTDYIFVGPAIFLNAEEMDVLLSFVDRGNNAFIASNQYPRELMAKVVADTCVGKGDYHPSPYTQKVKLNFYHPALRTPKGYVYAYREGTADVPHSWSRLAYRMSCDKEGAITPLGYQEPGGVNFVSVQHGKGKIFIHTNPIVFTNYFLSKEEKLEYASGVFGHLDGKNIILDEFSKVPFDFDRGDNRYDSPLYFMLQQPALKYAWWLIIATAVLYIVFASRRRQRVIPVHEKKVNTSLEFVQLISTLYYQNGNPLDMARKKMRYFLYLLRSRYGFTAVSPGDEQLAVLAEKSKVSVAEIKTIFDQFAGIDQNAYNNSQTDKLMGLFNTIENFKKKCK